MAVLLLAEVNNGELSLDATAKAVTAAADNDHIVLMFRIRTSPHLLPALMPR